MIRLRHASQFNARGEANEIILLNSHDGTSSYQVLAGMLRFVCSNGLVCVETVADLRVPLKGDVAGHVIEGAYQVLHGFERALLSREPMQASTLDEGEAEVFARAVSTTAARTCGACSAAPKRTRPKAGCTGAALTLPEMVIWRQSLTPSRLRLPPGESPMGYPRRV